MKQRLLLAVKGFNTNLVHFLLSCHIIISNMHVCCFTGTTYHMHGRATKTILCAQNFV